MIDKESNSCFTGKTDVLIPARYEIISAIIGELETFEPEFYRNIMLYSAIPEKHWNEEITNEMQKYFSLFGDLSFYGNRKLVSFKDLTRIGKKVYTYCVAPNNTVQLGVMHPPSLFKRKKDVYKIEVGYVTYFYSTENQQIHLRNGTKKPVSELKENDSLRTFSNVENNYIFNFKLLKEIETKVSNIEFHITEDVYYSFVDTHSNFFIYAKYENGDAREDDRHFIEFDLINVGGI